MTDEHRGGERHEELLAILQGCFNPREEGWMWLATSLLDDERGGVVNQIEGAYEEPIATADSLARIITECGADRVHLSVCRWDGRPTEDDRLLWRRLRDGVDPGLLVDMVVFNRRDRWSMRGEDFTAQHASGRPADRSL